ncbi:hypothetical protein GCM10027589_50290 [Actinocorallia lasiicapitis]
MARSLPPDGYTPDPVLHTLPADSVLWRVHRRGRTADGFNSRLTDVNDPRGGRFDGTGRHPYPSLYAGCQAATALSELLLRDLPFGDDGYRQIPRAAVRGRRASVMFTLRELTLVDLRHEEGLNAVAQDAWLVAADSADFHLTRHWAGWIHDHTPKIQGFIWQSRRHQAHHSVVLFGDRCEPVEDLVAVEEPMGVDLDGADGAAFINHVLAPHRARIDPPGRP